MAENQLTQAYIKGSSTVTVNPDISTTKNELVLEVNILQLVQELIGNTDKAMISYGTGAPTASTPGRIYLQLPG